MIAWNCANKALTADSDDAKCAAWCTLAFRIVCLISQTPSLASSSRNDNDTSLCNTTEIEEKRKADMDARTNALVIVHKMAVCLIRCGRMDEARRVCMQGE